MKFAIAAQHVETKESRSFIYDNESNTLQDSAGVVIAAPEEQRFTEGKAAVVFGKDQPLKKQRNVSLLKIQLGLSCNYSCDYCSQRFVERAPETSKKDIDAFMERLQNLNFIEENGLKIELWGGEPLVYWKTMKPLVEALNQRFARWHKKPRYSIITNGSLLTREICHWLYVNNFSVAISHDGPGQHVRGPDPLEDPAKREVILAFYKKMKPQGRISFNAMLNAQNTSRKAIYEWFVNFTGDPDVPLGEGSLVDAYDDGGMEASLSTKAQHFAFRKQAFHDVMGTAGRIGFQSIIGKINEFTDNLLRQRPAEVLGQKCGMDNPHVIAIDLKGNVMTCQNVSAVSTSHNGESHCAGNIADIKAVQVKTSTHWRNRPDCSKCPVLHLCKGACMFVEGDNWTTTCANSYTDNIALFALGFIRLTNGFMPLAIQAEDNSLPAERSDIWGDVLEHVEEVKRKPFPVRVVTQKASIEGVEVYQPARSE